MMGQRSRSSVVGRQIVVLTIAALLAGIGYTFDLGLVGRASQAPSALSQVQEWMVQTDGTAALGRRGSLLTPRFQHTATALTDGSVLVVGGQIGAVGTSASAEVYNPESGTSHRLRDMSTPRSAHTATLLPNGRVLVAGGFTRTPGSDAPAEEQNSAEVFDPARSSWSSVPPMRSPRAFHTATLLHDGRVLIVGGSVNSLGVVGAEIFAPTSNAWTDAGQLSELRVGHTATLLSDGRVLVVGGTAGTSAGYLKTTLIFDPARDGWSNGPDLMVGRSQHSATRLDDGRVLVTGGVTGMAIDIASTEIYDPVTNSWTAGPALRTPRVLHVATKLQGGRVLVAGGMSQGSGVSTVELFDPVRMTWYQDSQVSLAAMAAAATELPNGDLLTSGGLGVGGQQAPAGPALAVAGTNDYPTSGYISSCAPGYQTCGSDLRDSPQDTIINQWGFYNRECTSFAAWRMYRDGHAIHNADGLRYGNAWHWWTNAIYLGIPTTTVKVAGAVAQSDSIGSQIWDTQCQCWHASGHLAYEETPSSSTVEDYNWASTGVYAEHAWDPGRYILFGHSIVLTSNSFSFSSPGNGGSQAGPSTWLGGGYYTWEIRTTGSAGNFASKVWQSVYLGPDTYTSTIYEVVSGSSSSIFDFKGKVCGSFYGCATLDWGNITLADGGYTAWSSVYN